MSYLSLLLSVLLFLSGCSEQQSSSSTQTEKKTLKKELKPNSALTTIKEKKEITFIMLNAPTVFYKGPDGNTGYEYDMALNFANYLGVNLKIFPVYTPEEAMQALKNGKGDISAAGFSITEERKKEYLFGPSFYTVRQKVVCNSNIKAPRDSEALLNYSIVVPTDTTYEQTLKALQQATPSFHYQALNESSESILKQINENSVECTLVDSNVYAYNRRYFTNIREAFTIGKDEPLAWLLRKSETDLRSELDSWYSKFSASKEAEKLEYRYYAFTEFDDNEHFKTFSERVHSRLNNYSSIFKSAAEEYNIPWQFLAAYSYKESYWRSDAKGHEGKEGLMMLSEKTAQEYGVNDRLNPKENIFAGTKNLVFIEKQIPQEIKNPIQRLYYTLLAYKIGLNHLNDAIIFAKSQGLDPYNWNDFKTIVTLLSKKEYFSKTEHGYANFIGAIIYVNHVIDLYDILKHNDT